MLGAYTMPGRQGAGEATGIIERLAGRVTLLWGWRRALLALFAGAAGSFAQAPYDFFAIGFISFPLLVWLLDAAASEGQRSAWGRLRATFIVGWWFGFGYFAGGLWWIGNAMLVDIRAYAWALPIAVLALPAGLAIFYGLAAALARPLWNCGFGRIAALAAAFAVAEWLRGFVLSGFPWNAVGYAAMPTPLLMQSVGLVGLMGMNALAVFAFALPAALGERRAWRQWAAIFLLALLAIAHAAYGLWRIPASMPQDARSLQVRIVQPSIPQSEKWDRARRDEIFGTYLELSGGAVASGDAVPQLILWPETAVPFLLADRPDALSALGERIGEDQVLLAGAVRREGAADDAGARYYNSVVAINSDGVQFDAVDKEHLVPLGEYVPFEDWLSRIGVTRLVQMPGGFSSGVTRRPMEVAPGVRAAAFICYEVIFPGLVADGVQGADLLVNVTNDGWFGASPGPYQHFRQAQIRAVESGLPLVRAANNGISGAVDAYGRVIDALELDGVGILDVAVPLVRAQPAPGPGPLAAGWAIVALLATGALSANAAGRRSSVN